MSALMKKLEMAPIARNGILARIDTANSRTNARGFEVPIMQSSLAHTVTAPTMRETIANAVGGSEYPITTKRGPIGRAVTAAKYLQGGPIHAPRYGLKRTQVQDNSLQGARLPPVARQNNSYNLVTAGVDLTPGDYKIISKRPRTIGMSDEARISAGNTAMNTIVGANRALAQGQWAMASYILQRQLTEEEIATRHVQGAGVSLDNANLPGKVEEVAESTEKNVDTESPAGKALLEEARKNGWKVEPGSATDENGNPVPLGPHIMTITRPKQTVAAAGSQGRQGIVNGIQQQVKVGPFGVPTIENRPEKLKELAEIMGSAKKDDVNDRLAYAASKNDRPTPPEQDKQLEAFQKATPEGSLNPMISSDEDLLSKFTEIVQNQPESVKFILGLAAPILTMAPGIVNEPGFVPYISANATNIRTNTSGNELGAGAPMDDKSIQLALSLFAFAQAGKLNVLANRAGRAAQESTKKSVSWESSQMATRPDTNWGLISTIGEDLFDAGTIVTAGVNGFAIAGPTGALAGVISAALINSFSVLAQEFIQQLGSPYRAAAEVIALAEKGIYQMDDAYTQQIVQLAQMQIAHQQLPSQTISLKQLQQYALTHKAEADAAARRLDHLGKALVPTGAGQPAYSAIDYEKDQLKVREYTAVTLAIQQAMKLGVSQIRVEIDKAKQNKALDGQERAKIQGPDYNNEDYGLPDEPGKTPAETNVESKEAQLAPDATSFPSSFDAPQLNPATQSAAQSFADYSNKIANFDQSHVHAAIAPQLAKNLATRLSFYSDMSEEARRPFHNINDGVLLYGIVNGIITPDLIPDEVKNQLANQVVHQRYVEGKYGTYPHYEYALTPKQTSDTAYALDNQKRGGEGLVKEKLHADIGDEHHYRLGRYRIDKPALLKDKLLVIRKAENGGMVKKLPKILEVSPQVANHFLTMIHTGRVPEMNDISDNQRKFIHTVLDSSKARHETVHEKMMKPHREYRSQQRMGLGAGDLQTQLAIAQGQIRSGNNNPEVRAHMHHLLQQMGKNHTSVGGAARKQFGRLF